MEVLAQGQDVTQMLDSSLFQYRTFSTQTHLWRGVEDDQNADFIHLTPQNQAVCKDFEYDLKKNKKNSHVWVLLLRVICQLFMHQFYL